MLNFSITELAELSGVSNLRTLLEKKSLKTLTEGRLGKSEFYPEEPNGFLLAAPAEKCGQIAIVFSYDAASEQTTLTEIRGYLPEEGNPYGTLIISKSICPEATDFSYRRKDVYKALFAGAVKANKILGKIINSEKLISGRAAVLRNNTIPDEQEKAIKYVISWASDKSRYYETYWDSVPVNDRPDFSNLVQLAKSHSKGKDTSELANRYQAAAIADYKRYTDWVDEIQNWTETSPITDIEKAKLDQSFEILHMLPSQFDSPFSEDACKKMVEIVCGLIKISARDNVCSFLEGLLMRRGLAGTGKLTGEEANGLDRFLFNLEHTNALRPAP